MPKYVYETLSASGEILRTFEVWQGIHDPALESDPDTGEKVRRIISHTSVIGSSASASTAKASPSSGHGCRGHCSCKH